MAYKIEITMNSSRETLHCPVCGQTEFYKPANFSPCCLDWNRCKNCGTDVKFDDSKMGIDLTAVIELCGNPVRDRFLKKVRGG